MNTKLMKTPALILLTVVSASGLLAQGLVSQKIGVIDMQSALISTRDGQKAVADLRAKYSPRNDALQKRQQDLQTKQDQYRRTQNTISEEAKATLERDIDTLTRNIQRETQDAKEEMDESEQKMVTDLGGKVMEVLQKYATENHYTAIFDVSGQPTNILFASNTIEITREIIALYDKETAGSAPTPAAKPAGIPSGAAAPRKSSLPGTPAAPTPASPK